MDNFAWLFQLLIATALGSIGGGLAAYVAIKSKIAQHDERFLAMEKLEVQKEKARERDQKENDEHHARLEKDVSAAHNRIDRLLHDKILEVQALTKG